MTLRERIGREASPSAAVLDSEIGGKAGGKDDKPLEFTRPTPWQTA
jgi:hypothetical protein